MHPANNFFIAIVFSFFVSSLTTQTDPGFALIKKGTYTIGKKGHGLNPQRKVTVKSFYISKTEATNEEFKKFIDATGYKTDAERLKNAMVFKAGLKEFEWMEDSTAYWRFPNGISREGI